MKEEQYTITNKRGTRFYYKDPELKILHRLDGPAIEYSNGDKMWHANGKIHRSDGPALEMNNGYKSWFINGVYIFGVDKNDNIIDRMK